MTVSLRADWHLNATCARPEHSEVDFFPSDEDGPKAEPAKALCRICPVREICLDEAVQMSERAGIRGGMSTKDRKPLAIAAGTFNPGRWK